MKLNSMTLAAVAALLGGCSVGPDYVRPAVETPAAYKETGTWKPAEPRDDVNRGEWWEVFNDPLLNQLQQQIDVSNQNLAKAEAQYRQALALVQSARAGYYPTVTGGVSNTRSRSSATTIATPSVAPVSRGVVTNHSIPFQASWAPDVWGNIRRAVERHPVLGAKKLEELGFSRPIVLAVRHHHEWYNGWGFPDGLSGVAIPLLARILMVTDAYVSITSERPFRDGCSPLEALDEITGYAGVQFDTWVVPALEKIVTQKAHESDSLLDKTLDLAIEEEFEQGQ